MKGYDPDVHEVGPEKFVGFAKANHAHGRMTALFEPLTANPPRNINNLLQEGSSLERITDHNTILQKKDSKSSWFLECGKVLSGFFGRPGRTPKDLPHGPHADTEDKSSEGPIDPRNLQQESYKGCSRYKRPEKAGGKGFLPPP